MNLNPIVRAAKADAVSHAGVLTGVIQCDKPQNFIPLVRRFAWWDATKKRIAPASDIAAAGALATLLALGPAHLDKTRDAVWFEDHNAYVATGLNNAGDREFGLGGTAVGFIGVSSNTTTVTLTTVFLNGASGGAAANTIIKAISPAATRTGQIITGGATFANADFTSGVFIINKIGFLTTSTDAGTGLVDVIGGTGGTAPYNKPFSLDLTNVGTFTLVAQIAVTLAAA